MRIDDVSIVCLWIDSVLFASAPPDTVNVLYIGLVSDGVNHFGKTCWFREHLFLLKLGLFCIIQRELVD